MNGKEALVKVIREVPIAGKTYEEYVEAVAESLLSHRTKTIEERIKYAEQKRDEAISDGTLQDLTYWHGYITALREIRDEQRKAD